MIIRTSGPPCCRPPLLEDIKGYKFVEDLFKALEETWLLKLKKLIMKKKKF